MNHGLRTTDYGLSTMKDFLRNRWFLLLLLIGLALAWFRPQSLRPATVWLEPRIIVAAALFLMAWSLESRSLFQSLTHPLPALWALIISYGALPVLAWWAGWLLPDADLRLGLLIIASVPCTLSSAVLWTRMAGGNEATALLTVLLTTATSWLITPAWLAFAARQSVVLDVPGMMASLVLVLIVPVGLGQLSRVVRPLARTAARHKVLLGGVARLFIFSIILKAAVEVSERLSQESTPPAIGWISAAAALCVGTHLAALTAGLWSSRLLHFDRAGQIAVAFAGSQKTLPVSLYLFDLYFKESYPLAVVPMVVYHVGQLVVDTLIADVLARHPSGSRVEKSMPADAF
jgi:solute carrier family 10 (sodium/bile acid cotransporter), member 7